MTRDLNNHFVKWKVSLDNGENCYEGKGNFQELAGELSPWQKLQKHITDNGLKITSLSLYTDCGKTWQLPSLGLNPKFSEFSTGKKPDSFNFCRKIARDSNVVDFQAQKSRVVEWYTVAIAIYEGFEVQVWVDELNISNSWVVVKE